MATIEKQPETALAIAEWQHADRSKASRYLNSRLTETRADYYSVTVATFVLVMAVTGICWLACGILVEHWLLIGGMPVWLRWGWLLVGMAGLLAASVRWLLPLFRYRVNILYAARSIEREFPELHNDLINAMLINPMESEPHSDLITGSLEQRAARQLTGVPTDGVFDKHHLVRLAFALALLVISCTCYALLSPKNPFVTAARLFAPWSDWDPPSRVRIESVKCYWTSTATADQLTPPEMDVGTSLLDARRELPLDKSRKTQIIRGRQLVVAAQISQLRQREVPLLRVTPLLDDGRKDSQDVSWETDLKPQAGATVFWSRLPAPQEGLNRSVQLKLQAGDAAFGPFDVLVVDAPSVLVKKVVYHFPAYTGRSPETREWQGDLRGVEGTEVELQVESNQPLDAAWIDFLDTTRSEDLRMVVDRDEPTLASVNLLLRRKADRSGPEHPDYRLRFRPEHDRDAGSLAIIDETLTHRIEVLPDLAPEVSIDLPDEDPVRVPPDQPVRVRVRAFDPDYAVSSVFLETRPEGGNRLRQTTLWEARQGRSSEASGTLRMSTRIVPSQAAVGANVLEYRAIVVDNRQPEPNSTATPWQRLIIDERASPQPDSEKAWPARRQPKPETPARGEDKPPGQGSADGKPVQELANERKPEEASENQQLTDQPPLDGQQSTEEADGKPGMQDSSGMSGPQDGRGQQSSQQQPGQSESGERESGVESKAASENNGDFNGQEQNTGQRGGNNKNGSPSDEGTERSETRALEGQGAQPGREVVPQEARGGKDRTEGDTQESSQATGNKVSDETEQSKQGKPTEGASKPKSGNDSREAPAQHPVSAEGADDGEAMERIIDHQQRQAQKSPSENQSGESSLQQESCCPEEGKPCGKPGCSSCNGGGGGTEAGDGASSGGSDQPADGGNSTGSGESRSGVSGTGKAGNAETPGGGALDATSSPPEGSSAGSGENTTEELGGSEGQPGKASGEPSGASQAGGNTAGDTVSDNASSESQSPGSGSADQSSTTPNVSSTGGQLAKQGEQSADGSAESGKKVDPSVTDTQQSAGGGAVGGERESQIAGDEPPVPAESLEWQSEDLAAEMHAVDLAMTHLRDSVRSGDDGVLDELGWNQEQAEAFLNRWKAMRDAAASDQRQRREFERAVRSLGLRPEGVQTSRRLPTSREGKRLEGRRTQPPLEYRERFKAYQKGTGSGWVETE